MVTSKQIKIKFDDFLNKKFLFKFFLKTFFTIRPVEIIFEKNDLNAMAYCDHVIFIPKPKINGILSGEHLIKIGEIVLDKLYYFGLKIDQMPVDASKYIINRPPPKIIIRNQYTSFHFCHDNIKENSKEMLNLVENMDEENLKEYKRRIKIEESKRIEYPCVYKIEESRDMTIGFITTAKSLLCRLYLTLKK